MFKARFVVSFLEPAISNLPCNVLKETDALVSKRTDVRVSRDDGVRRTCGKPLLGEGQSVATPLQLHVDPRQGAPLVHELHR